MTYEIVYGILNYNRSASVVNKIIDKLDNRKIVVATNNPDRLPSTSTIMLPDNSTVAIGKNLILNKYKQETNPDVVKICFIVEDDVQIVDSTVFEKYARMMIDYNLPLVMYGYHGNRNKVLNRIHNPIIVIYTPEGELYVNRMFCFAVSGFRIEESMVMFDERLKSMEGDFYVHDLKVSGKYPFSGFHLDIKESWKCFVREDIPSTRKKTQEMLEDDATIRGIREVPLDNNADAFFDYVIASQANRV